MDHKVGKQRVKTICLDLSVETNESWLNNGACRESACGCTGAYHVLQHRVHASEGSVGRCMVHPH